MRVVTNPGAPPARALPSVQARRRDPERARRARPWTRSRPRSTPRGRSAATEERTTIVPCPWARSARALSSSSEPAPSDVHLEHLDAPPAMSPAARRARRARRPRGSRDRARRAVPRPAPSTARCCAVSRRIQRELSTRRQPASRSRRASLPERLRDRDPRARPRRLAASPARARSRRRSRRCRRGRARAARLVRAASTAHASAAGLPVAVLIAQPQAPSHVRAQTLPRIDACAQLLESAPAAGYIAAEHRPGAGARPWRGRPARPRRRPARPPSSQRGPQSRARRRACRSRASSPRSGTRAGPPLPGPKRLRTARYIGRRRSRSATEPASSVSSRPRRDGELVLHEPARPIQPVPVAERVEREELRAHPQLRARARGAGASASAAR